jgi:hypothetical protein
MSQDRAKLKSTSRQRGLMTIGFFSNASVCTVRCEILSGETRYFRNWETVITFLTQMLAEAEVGKAQDSTIESAITTHQPEKQ